MVADPGVPMCDRWLDPLENDSFGPIGDALRRARDEIAVHRQTLRAVDVTESARAAVALKVHSAPTRSRSATCVLTADE